MDGRTGAGEPPHGGRNLLDIQFEAVRGTPGIETPEDFLEAKYGRRWREHLVPDPLAYSKKSGIADMAPGAEEWTPPEFRAGASRTLGHRIVSSCAGRANRPTTLELYEAFHTETPTDRSTSLLLMWMNEGSQHDLIDAWRDHCYTWRELAAACRRHGLMEAVAAPTLHWFRQDVPGLGTCAACGDEPARGTAEDGRPLCAGCGDGHWRDG